MASQQEDQMKAILDQIQMLGNLPKQIENVREDIKGEVSAIKESLEYSQGQLHTAIVKLEEQAKMICKLQTELNRERQQRQVLEEKLLKMEHRFALSEDYIRRYNLIIYGIPETKDENCHVKVSAFFRNTMKINEELKLDTVHRLGKPVHGRDRQMIVRFLTQDHRKLAWEKRRELKGTGFFLNEDFSAETRNKRSTLQQVLKEARKQDMRSSLTGASLLIEGRRYTVDTLHTLPPEIDPVKISTRNVGENSGAFFSHLSPLSNFHNASFKVDGQWFSSTEQYFTYHKALSVKDESTAGKILNTSNPVTIKRMGNAIHIPPGSKWNADKLEIMRQGCWEKFSQNPKLSQFLLGTGNKELIEAGPDAYWGAGVRLNSPHLQDNSWTGQNKLGQILVREKLKSCV